MKIDNAKINHKDKSGFIQVRGGTCLESAQLWGSCHPRSFFKNSKNFCKQHHNSTITTPISNE